MDPNQSPEPAAGSLAKVFADALAVLAALVVVAALLFWRPAAAPTPPPPVAPTLARTAPTMAIPAPPAPEPVAVPEPEPAPEPSPPPPTGPDPEVIAAAESQLAAARSALETAEDEESRLAETLERADVQSLAVARELEEAGRDARALNAEIDRATARLAALKADRERLDRAVSVLAETPPPREALNRDQSPVARTVTGEEYHFEIRGDRVAFVDLDRLIEMAAEDAKLRLRMISTTPSARPMKSTVGPVGAFSLKYEMGRAGIGLVNDMMGPALATSYTLLGFEVVPKSVIRGETLDIAFSPASEFGRVMHRLDPRSTTITLWVYPSGFPLFRVLRDALNQRGFAVAARPLPEGIPIRGGPNGSRSSAQ